MTPPPIPRRHFLARLFGAIAGGAWLSKAEPAAAGEQEFPYLGEIRMFGGDFEPYGWRFCDGRLLVINDYDALFSLIGTTYGGDGQTTFGLPDLRGRIPFHPNTGGFLGEPRGQESVVLLSGQSPVHSHNLQGNSGLGISDDPTGRVPAKNALGAPHYSLGGDTTLASTTLVPSGGSQPHNNMMPSLCVTFIICVDGVYPLQT